MAAASSSQEEAWTAVAADATAAFLTKCARNPGRWFYPCSANHREPRRCAFEFRRASEDNTAPRRLIVRVEECAYTEGGTGWRVWPCALLLAGAQRENALIRTAVSVGRTGPFLVLELLKKHQIAASVRFAYHSLHPRRPPLFELNSDF